MTDRPRLLFVSPVVPALTGNGLAMRAATTLEILAERHEVWLLVVPLYPPFDGPVPEAIAGQCRGATVVPFAPRIRLPPLPGLSASARPGAAPGGAAADLRVGKAAATYQGVRFDVVHVFRLAALPYARPYLEATNPPPRKHLDLDDVESTTHRRLAALHRANGDDGRGRLAEAEAERSRDVEDVVLRDVDRVYVCSEADRERLRGRGRAEVVVLPNAVRVPEIAPSPPAGARFSLLFVGNLGYYPNEDAVRYFCAEILPVIRRKVAREVGIDIVGGGSPRALRALATASGANLAGAVPDVTPWYRDATAVAVPIRAGGGTRIKVLEAFAHRRPVVSTSVGVEGIDVVDGVHALVADDPDAFAQHCLSLMNDPARALGLVEAARSLLADRYSVEAVKRRFAATPGPGAARRGR